jgi:CubicO group peptidase (beta-lactamase class C family)
LQIRYLILLLGSALLAVMAGAVRPVWQPNVTGGAADTMTPAIKSEMQTWLRDAMRRNSIPGMAIAVVRGGKLQQQVALGHANVWTREPLTVDTLMEVASISKVVTALAALREVGEGRLTLDRPLAEYRSDFDIEGEYRDDITLAMLLTHTAGLSNAIEQRPVADEPPGEGFRYSGQGFELVGQLIASGRDAPLPDVLRETVLTPLGLSQSATYGEPGAGDRLASPHVSLSIPFVFFLVPTFVLLLGGSMVWIARRIMGRRDPLGMAAATVLLLVSVSVGLLLPFLLLSSGNASRFLVVNLALATLLALIAWSWRRAIRLRYRPSGVLLTVFAVAILAWTAFRQPPMPLEHRAPDFPATAGLRASVTDMGRMLAALLSPPPELRDEVAMLTEPRVSVNEENSWGPGIGIQQIGEELTIWHWGINFPGYQALMLGRPATGDGVVVLVNGGSLTMTMGSPRYSGLELAREVAARVLPGAHGAYWQGIQ